MVHIGQELNRPVNKWGLGVVAAGEIMSYSVVDPQGNYSVANIASGTTRLRKDIHFPCLDISELKQQRNIK